MASSGVIIVGGGVSGLATAYFLATKGITSTLFEKKDHLGGLIKTDLVEGCRLEAGPDSFLSAKPAVTEIAGMLGLADHIIGSNDKARRVYVVRDGKLVPMPKGMVMMVPAQWRPVFYSRLLSMGTKARLLAEIFEKPTIRSEDVSVGQFVEDHFGKEVLEYIAEPLLCGVYGGDSAILSAESVLPRFLSYEARYGSVIKGVREESGKRPTSGALFSSFRNGMAELIDALASGSQPHCTIVHSAVTNVEQTASGWRVSADRKTLDGSALVLACPSYVNGELLANVSPVLASYLSSIPYSSAVLVTLLLKAPEIRGKLDGFGFLVPRAERRSIAAATCIHNKFPGRVLSDLAGIRAFIVGKQAKELLNAPESELVSLVREELRRLTGIQAQPVFSTLYRWPDSMPQYVVGHKERQRAIADALEHFAGLYLVGNSYDGVGIPDCVRLAKQAADRISSE